uniref:ARAD1D02552p n=1 Tax=Blastobotrys adeninivorans TaxID=409370 RepID=A0A060T8C5_BLAAD
MEEAKWSAGSKGKSKKEAEEEKKAEQARKKAEREAQLKAEEEALPAKGIKSKQKGQEKAGNRRRGIDDALKASGIEDAIDALDIATGKNSNKKDVERHPERRFKAAYLSYEERRLPELKDEHPGLRLNQYKELIRKEFEKSSENPFNQTTVAYNATSSEVRDTRSAVKKATEERLMNNR